MRGGGVNGQLVGPAIGGGAAYTRIFYNIDRDIHVFICLPSLSCKLAVIYPYESTRERNAKTQIFTFVIGGVGSDACVVSY